MWAPPPTSDFFQSKISTCQWRGLHWPPFPEIPGLATLVHGLHCTVGTSLPCTGGCSWCFIALWGSLTWVWEGMLGDWKLWASWTCRSRAMGTIGADCSRVARATTTRAPASATWLGEFGFWSIEIPAFGWGGGGGGWHVLSFPGVWSFGAL